jgi:hypothetical protein
VNPVLLLEVIRMEKGGIAVEKRMGTGWFPLNEVIV